MNSFCKILFLNDRVLAFPADIGKTIIPTPITDRAIEFELAPIITIVSTDSNIKVRVF